MATTPLALVIAANRERAEESLRGQAVTREPLDVPAGSSAT
jgi:hypothetical protein